MRIAVKLFAAARELAGTSELLLDLPDGSSVAEVRKRLSAAVPALAPLAERSLMAVNAQYAGDALEVSADDEVALIPPVSGG
jgi:sulfur-carrier protein